MEVLLLVLWVVFSVLGVGGRRPPRASMPRAIIGSGPWKPNAARVMARSFVLTDSISPLDRKFRSEASMPGRAGRKGGELQGSGTGSQPCWR
jgi:hypothetical protein